ncbi:hypothetical protein MSG28_001743 [Choristoneura fumiferana]|uniref:Uncharacterized protein n=1 Tax=Choristoneura fumiferana TaxID=7141 RepID=A0ACC0KVW0_CHOFU|nr:hypothetical protein MSG28_001743 [Choristoneura fumiferana]
MYSVLTRGNAILTYTLSVLACLTFLCFLSTLTVDYRTNAQMNTVKVVVKNVPDYGVSRERNDLGFLTFDLKTDLSHLFNWNVKQLFLYLTAEYITPNNELNQIVLWDKIILRGENAVLDFKNMNTKYYFWDDGKGLKGHNNVTLTLSWNIIPNAGLLPNIMALGYHSFRFPTEYTQTRRNQYGYIAELNNVNMVSVVMAKKAYPCPEKDCTKAYTNKSHLDRHINSVHKVPDNDMLYSCELCLKEFVSLHEKKKHVRSHKTHRCNQCPATFNLWSKYQKHVKNDHLGKVVCLVQASLHAEYHEDDIYLAHRVLQAHSAAEFAEIRNFGNPLEDRVPGQPFSYSDHNAVTLELRLCRTDTTSNERPGPVDDVLLDQTIAKAYQAEIRNFGNPLEDRVPGQPFSYSDHNAVTLELRLCRTDTTSNERPGPVDDVLLDQTIAKAYQASTASKEETPKRGSTLLKCTTCNTFSTLSSRALTTHMAQCSPDNNNVAAAQNADRPHRKLFECDVCNMKFSNGANMRRHKMRHTGVKPYECRVCQKRFFRKDHLAEHFTTHTKSLPYHCPICNRGFQRQIAMRAHFQNEHVGQHDLVKTCPLCSYRAPTMKSLRVHFFNRHGIDLDNPGTGNNSVSLLAAGIANAAYADGTMDASAINALGALGSGLSVSVAAAYSDSGDSNGERSVDNATPPMHYLTPHVEISMADNNETFSPGQSNHNSDSRMNGEGPSSPQSGDSAGAVASSSLSAQLPAGITPSITLIPIKQEPNTQEESGGGESQGEANGGDKRGVSSSLSSLIKGGVITSTHGEAAAAPASLVCSFCAITFPDSTLYFLHKGCHCDSNPWKCNICGEQCCNVYEFNSHLLSKSHQ